MSLLISRRSPTNHPRTKGDCVFSIRPSSDAPEDGVAAVEVGLEEGVKNWEPPVGAGRSHADGAALEVTLGTSIR